MEYTSSGSINPRVLEIGMDRLFKNPVMIENQNIQVKI